MYHSLEKENVGVVLIVQAHRTQAWVSIADGPQSVSNAEFIALRWPLYVILALQLPPL